MANESTVYVCTKCDAQHPKWSGRCSECGTWGTLKQETKRKKKNTKKVGVAVTSAPAEVATFDKLAGKKLSRILCTEFPSKKIFSEGIVLGSIVLFTGEPGAGKSTLSLQIAQNVSADHKALYISAEESSTQVKERGDRLGKFRSGFMIAESHDLEQIISTIRRHSPELVIIDSLQSISSSESEAEAGSINQIRIVTAALSQEAKSAEVAIIVIGHVTKDGALAGPKSLEHLVDAVYYLESDKNSQYRLLRCFKNRHGQTGTVSVMQLTKSGLKEVKDAATIFIQNFKPKPGSVLTVTNIDNQLFFVEVQALVTKSSFGYAKRTSSGFSKSRLELLLAIIKKHLHIDCDSYDVFINVTGGFRVTEPAMDLAVVLSVLSSLKDNALPKSTVVFGEVGLSGELRIVRDTSLRLKEIEKNKFSGVFIPVLNTKVQSQLKISSSESLTDVVKSLRW